MKLTGHTTEAVHRGYTHHEMESLRAAILKLPDPRQAVKKPAPPLFIHEEGAVSVPLKVWTPRKFGTG